MKAIKLCALVTLCLAQSAIACNSVSKTYVDQAVSTSQTYLQNQINQASTTKSYASASTNTLQLLTLANTFVPVDFGSNNFTPVNITHTTATDSSMFQVANTGIYQINWYISIYDDRIAENDIIVDLVNLTTAQSLLPPNKMIGSFAYDASPGASHTRYLNISGSMMVSLNANDIFNLELSQQFAGNLVVNSAAINITQIA
tara:strand:+ start:476 stop:1078 length:603 start_codon:yes stop_codon:yes gene_type:complete